MIQLKLATGMRPGEVRLMRMGDIDISGDVWEYRPQEHKTEHHGKQRVIAIGPKAQAILGKYLDRPEHEHCFKPGESEAIRREDDLYVVRLPTRCHVVFAAASVTRLLDPPANARQ